MTTERIAVLKAQGIIYNPDLGKNTDYSALDKQAAETYEWLKEVGLPIIENGKIIGTRFPPDENGNVKEIYKIKKYKLETEEVSSVLSEPSVEKKSVAKENIKTQGVTMNGKKDKTKNVNPIINKNGKANNLKNNP